MNDFDPSRYSVLVRKETTEEGVCFVARIQELPHVEILADSAEEAYDDAIDVIETAFEMAQEQGERFPTPSPVEDREYSGRLPLRVPKSLHRALVQAAKVEGMSLNAYATYLLGQNSMAADLSRAGLLVAGPNLGAATGTVESVRHLSYIGQEDASVH